MPSAGIGRPVLNSRPELIVLDRSMLNRNMPLGLLPPWKFAKSGLEKVMLRPGPVIEPVPALVSMVRTLPPPCEYVKTSATAGDAIMAVEAASTNSAFLIKFSLLLSCAPEGLPDMLS